MSSDAVAPWRGRVSRRKIAAVVAATAALLLAALGARADEPREGTLAAHTGPYAALAAHVVQAVVLDSTAAARAMARPTEQTTRTLLNEPHYTAPPVDPTAVYSMQPANAPSEVGHRRKGLAPEDLLLYRDSQPGSGTPGRLDYDPNEPTAAANGRVFFYTGNIYARLSGDYGTTWSTIDPYATFPTAAGGLGGEFVTHYDSGHGILVWSLHYLPAANGNNIHRLAVSVGQSEQTANRWTYWDLSAQSFGFANGTWLDYPDIQFTTGYLYASANVIRSSDLAQVGCVVYRISLNQLKAKGSITYQWVTPSSFSGGWASYRLASLNGNTNTLCFASHVDNNTVRIYTWSDNSGSTTYVDRDVAAWFTGTSVANSPDGTNWLAADKHRILGVYYDGFRVTLLWDSAQGGGYAQPNVRFVVFKFFDWTLDNQGVIWNSQYAWAYPSAGLTSNSVAGGTIYVGGGTSPPANPFPYPSAAA
jgi:hypothetical protein